jgi:hypothetical protein
MNNKSEVHMTTENKDLTLEISTKKKIYETGEKIEVNCSLKNISSSTLVLAPLLHPQTLHLYFGDSEENAERVDLKRFIQELIRNITLKPTETYNFNETLGSEGSLYNFRSQKGKYSTFIVYENYNKKCKNVAVWTGSIKSNTLIIEIK